MCVCAGERMRVCIRAMKKRKKGIMQRCCKSRRYSGAKPCRKCDRQVGMKGGRVVVRAEVGYRDAPASYNT